MAKTKERIDVLLVEKGLAESREKAKALILAGLVNVDGLRVDKPGTDVPVTAAIELQGSACPFVSRGGLKLAKALEVFPLDLNGKVVLDVGASTGGFTDCALQHGAAKVFAVDVGYGQLAWSLRNDPRVVSLERTNARYLTLPLLGEQVDFVTIDVAFISLTKIFPALRDLLMPENNIVALVKPQFEAGKEKVGKKGVVKDPVVHKEVLYKVLNFAEETGFSVLGLDFSPVKGPEGNIEYLAWLSYGADNSALRQDWVEQAVSYAHGTLS